MELPLWKQILMIVGSAIMLTLAIYLMSVFNSLFAGIRYKWLRKNLAVLLVALCFMFSLTAISSELYVLAEKKGWLKATLFQVLNTTLITFFVYNSFLLVNLIRGLKKLSFVKYHAIIILTIIISALLVYTGINYFQNGMKFVNLKATLLFSFYNAATAGLIYASVSYVELDRKRKLNEKELEVTRLMALKTKAELDALHSKVNPHFLYNALNSIADLSVTDGKKARRMTIALADLFRYSINYSQNNFSSVNDEVAMTEVYLQIEKIRFEDQLNYTVLVEPEAGHYLVPRFLLQPLVENAVKHGLKATGLMTEIHLRISLKEESLQICIVDNGPAFPDELTPGYGVKSVYDKMDLLFPGLYEIRFINQPVKQVVLTLNKLIKNEPVI
ncbi:MAG TPA: histidine kinase [Chitinophagaceae bacterium]|nr:histidine kinase [Chitinophagaceae bacterium]